MYCFLDSGAFSAKSRGIDIKLEEYIQFIRKYKTQLTTYANLDVIGDASSTLLNQKKMEDAGLSPLPCYHMGEPLKYLENYIRDYDYIAIGGMVGARDRRGLVNWLDMIFKNYICDTQGEAHVKIHGFGMTAFSYVKRYPWYSIDSTSWFRAGIYGQVHIPYNKGGKWMYDKSPWIVSISNRKGGLQSYSPQYREIISQYIEDLGLKIGSSSIIKTKGKKGFFGNSSGIKEQILEEGVGNKPELRVLVNSIYFLNFLFSTNNALTNNLERYYFAGPSSNIAALTDLFDTYCSNFISKTGFLTSYVEGPRSLEKSINFVNKYTKKGNIL